MITFKDALTTKYKIIFTISLFFTILGMGLFVVDMKISAIMISCSATFGLVAYSKYVQKVIVDGNYVCIPKLISPKSLQNEESNVVIITKSVRTPAIFFAIYFTKENIASANIMDSRKAQERVKNQMYSGFHIGNYANDKQAVLISFKKPLKLKEKYLSSSVIISKHLPISTIAISVQDNEAFVAELKNKV